MEKKHAYGIDFLVGLFVCCGVISLLFFALKVSHISQNNKNGYSIIARFDNIGTLKVGASVKSAGVIVGRVSKIIFNDKVFQAQVGLTLDQSYKFPKDSQLKIVTSGLLGDQYVGIDAGADTEILKNGDIIEQTQSAIVLEDLIGKFLYSKAQDMGKEK
ncbi:MAG: outer rane lipid asymmetry maintenance protein MlaD [Pseudomonadota bacterium]|jgi:phospholipid/cholesterol/gamma-HCH transport system substrate-binding protein